MRRASAGLIAAVLALAGCKSDPKGDDKAPAGIAGRLKGKDAKDRDKDGTPAKNTTWLDDVAKLPGAGTSVPKATGGSDSNPKTEAQDALGGRVLDPAGRPARNVFVRIDQVGAPANTPGAGIYTNNEGYFFTRGLKPGQAYDLTAEATQADGKPLTGVVQTKVPNPVLLIVLRDDLPPPAGGSPAPKGPDGGTFPPTPRPSDKVGDGAWAPGGAITGVPPATIGGGSGAPKAPTPPGGALPPPDDLSAPPPGAKPLKPENVADGPKDPFKPPAANIPGPAGPPVPPLPTLPPSFGPTGGGKSSMGGTTTGGSAGKLALVDTLGRSWDLDAVKPGTLVLVEFITSTCVPCKQAIPVLKDLQSRYGASGLQVAAVLCDDLPQQERIQVASKYGRDLNLNYALYVEPGAAGSVRDRFGVESYPHAVLLNSAGRVLWKGHPGKKDELESAVRQNLGK